jgi:hypothetical protein
LAACLACFTDRPSGGAETGLNLFCMDALSIAVHRDPLKLRMRPQELEALNRVVVENRPRHSPANGFGRSVDK